MNILSVYAHNEPKSLTASLKNSAIGELLRQGHSVMETDLYAIGFSPKAEKYDFTALDWGHFNYMLEQKHTSAGGLLFSPDIMAEIEKVAKADIIIFHTPIWWFSVPAILKGWFDRVFAMGVTWDAGKIYDKGLLRGKSVMLCGIAGFPEDYYRAEGQLGATMNQMLLPIQHGIFEFCGLNVVEPFIVYNSLGLNQVQIDKVIQDYHFKISHLADSPNYLTKFD